MDTTTIPTAAAIAATFSLLLANLPFLSTWFDKLSSQVKVYAVLVLMIAVGVGSFLGANPGWQLSSLTWATALTLLANVATAIATSQFVHTQVNTPLAAGKSK